MPLNAMLVSVITPSFNSSKFLADAVNSVLQQTYRQWELLAVDDASSDQSAAMLQSFAKQDSRIRPILLSTNVGAAEARNIALRKAHGRFIAFLDSDDLWKPHKLERQLAFMRLHQHAFTFTDYELVDETGMPMGKMIHAPARLTYHRYLKNTIIGCLTVMLDRDVVGQVEMPRIRSSHDMALWLAIMKRGITAYGLSETLSSYRVVASSITSKKWRAARDVWRVYREIEKLGLPYSLYCFFSYSLHAALKRL